MYQAYIVSGTKAIYTSDYGPNPTVYMVDGNTVNPITSLR